MSIGDLYDQAVWMDVMFPDSGRWWADRGRTSVAVDGQMSVWLVGGKIDGDHHAVRLVGTPDALRRVAEAILAHVDAAETNVRSLNGATREGETS